MHQMNSHPQQNDRRKSNHHQKVRELQMAGGNRSRLKGGWSMDGEEVYVAAAQNS
jgi:hypothetical protein